MRALLCVTFVTNRHKLSVQQFSYSKGDLLSFLKKLVAKMNLNFSRVKKNIEKKIVINQ